MNESPSDIILQRIGTLEAKVRRLERSVADLQGLRVESAKERPVEPETTHADEPLVVITPPPVRPTPLHSVKSPLKEESESSERWLSKVGIALLLLGLAFLFKYSIDQGWLTPEVRVGIGVALGLGMIYASRRIESGHFTLSQVLAGGGIASLYISIFAAYQLFNLIPYGAAMILMTLATVVGFHLSVISKGLALAVISLIGGLLTPFILHTDTVNLPGLIGYTCMIMAGGCAIYWYRGWISLIWLSAVGGWLIALVGWGSSGGRNGSLLSGDKWMLEVGVLAALATSWVIPLLRDVFHARADAPSPAKLTRVGLSRLVVDDWQMHLLTFLAPFFSFLTSYAIWHYTRAESAIIFFSGSVVFGATAWVLLQKGRLPDCVKTHIFTGISLFTVGMFIATRGNVRVFVLGAEALALFIYARKSGFVMVRGLALALFWLTVPWMLVRLFPETPNTPFFNVEALVALWIIVVTLIVAWKYINISENAIYYLSAHISFLLLLFAELFRASNGQGLVSVAWGLYGVALLIVGLVTRRESIRTVALATLILVVGKLFVVDLASLKAIWRVLLFMGFGGVFLVVSYLFMKLRVES